MEHNQPASAQTVAVEEDGIDLHDLLTVLLKRTKLIIAVTLGLGLQTLLITLIMAPVYVAPAKMLIPQTTSATTAVIYQIAGAVGALMGLGDQVGSSTDTYAALLQCRTVLDSVIDKFNLLEIYKNERVFGAWRSYTRDDARLDLINLITIENDTVGNLITLGIQDKSPRKSADMANFLVDEILRLVNNLAVTDAGRKRVFFETQVRIAYEALSEAEENLKSFKESTGAIKLDQQARAILVSMAALEAQHAAEEIKLQVMRSYATPYNPDLKKVEAELNALKAQMKNLDAWEGMPGSSSTNLLIPIARIPSLGIEYLRKEREFRFQEAIYKFLMESYSNTRLEEAKESATIQVIDRAVVPENVYKPKRILVSVIATGVAFFLAIFMVFAMGSLEKAFAAPGNISKR